ncbi:glutamate-1-semialdehyde 2,1-aminomutase [bacterium]|nr:glutamate-1-semialdehyde 2,1-aminomutase [bacterium]
MIHSKSNELFERAKQLMPGGVNSPVRAFGSVGGQPIFIKRGKGCRVFDEDGNSYIDYVCSWGPLILGHAYPSVVDAIRQTAQDGTTFGAPTAMEVKMAEMIVDAVPSIEMVRLVSSGTEAVMSAIRLARGYTGRDKIIKFEGGYHGHADYMLAKAGSGVATFTLPDCAGVPVSAASDTIVMPYNDMDAVANAVNSMKDQIACIIVEPVAGNMGVVTPKQGFLNGLREICSANGILLIFDEVITGFRVSYGGAQELFGVTPDITTLGKIIGGGLPVGAYGGKREIMEQVAPVGPVYQAGTLSGNPIAVSAGIATMEALKHNGFYDDLNQKSDRLKYGIEKAAADAGIRVKINSVGSMMTVFFTDELVCDYASAKKSNTQAYARFFHAMLERGVYMAPSQFEAAFLSAAHGFDEIEYTIKAASEAFRLIV